LDLRKREWDSVRRKNSGVAIDGRGFGMHQKRRRMRENRLEPIIVN